jgi:hypothetical protein
MFISLYYAMKEIIHKYKDDWVILRFDENDIDRKKNKKSEYRTWSEWRSWVANAKIYWHEDEAAQALVKLRFLSKSNVW